MCGRIHYGDGNRAQFIRFQMKIQSFQWKKKKLNEKLFEMGDWRKELSDIETMSRIYCLIARLISLELSFFWSHFTQVSFIFKRFEYWFLMLFIFPCPLYLSVHLLIYSPMIISWFCIFFLQKKFLRYIFFVIHSEQKDVEVFVQNNFDYCHMFQAWGLMAPI